MNDTTNTSIAEYSPTAAALADLSHRMAKVVYDVSTPAGMAIAKKDRAEVRDLRVALEKKRVEIKSPALKRCQEIDTEAKRITAELLKYETPPDEAIKREEKRIEDIRLAAVAAEEKRKATIRERMNELYGNTQLTPASGASLIAEHIADLEAIAIDDSFAEFQADATEEKAAGLKRLRALHEASVKQEDEAERLRKERAELDLQRAKQAAADEAARALREAETRAENERIAAERRKFEAEQAAVREAQRKENERIAADQRAAQEVIDKANRELEARQRADREAVAKAEREAAEQKRLSYRPTFDEIVTVLSQHYRRDGETIRTWVSEVKAANKAAA